MNTTAWSRLLALYWAFSWRVCVTCLGLIITFYLVAAPIEAAAQIPPRVAGLFDLGLLLVLLLTGWCLALQWCSRARFGEYQLRVEPGRVVGLRFGQAARVVWAQLWRSAVVAIPAYFIAQMLLVPLVLMVLQPPTPVLQWLDRELTWLPFSAAIGMWAMREAIGLQYRGFALRWIQERSVQRQAIDPGRADEVV